VGLAGFADLSKLLTGSPAKLREEDRYGDMAIPRAGLAPFLGASIACDDFALPAEMAPHAGKGAKAGDVVPGIKSLLEKLKPLGTEQPGSGGACGTSVQCTGTGYQKAACDAAVRYIDLKADVRSSSTFRCDMFQSPDDPSSFCDPVGMRSEDGLDGVIWSDDCLGHDGALKRKQKTCSLPEFADYVRGFGPRLQHALKRLDDEMQLEQPGVGSSMRMLMERHILRRSDFIANGVTCRFFAAHYQEFINGGCYQGVAGLRSIAKSYVWCAVLAAMLVVTMYAVWCRSKGNIENWKEDRAEYKALLQREREAEEARQRAAEGKPEEEPTIWITRPPPTA